MMMRQWNASKIRYGFNGKENDNEVKGLGNQQDYGLRIFDPRLGKFLSVDPLTSSYPWYTPYQFAGNTPIQAIDLDGAEPQSAGKEEAEKGKDEIVQGTGMGGYGKVVRHWIWHKGGLKKADGTTTKADWYTSEDYLKTLSSTNAAATLAGDMNLYSNAALSNQKTQVDAGRNELKGFVENGLNENAAKHLIAAAKVRADNANFSVTGTTYQSSFNVEDILGIAVILRQGLKVLGSMATANLRKITGTVWDDIIATQPNYSGSILPKSFELSTQNGTKVWVHGNATEHIAEFIKMKAANYTPGSVRLATQLQLSSLQGAVNEATKNGVIYNQLINAGGWELKFAMPKSAGQLPALIHAMPK